MRPYFTIIIPTYNRASLISETLETVKNQVFNDFEVILIDNGSIDDTESAVVPYLQDARFTYFKLGINRERAWARNTGLEKATGKFVTFLDSDDFMYPFCLRDAYNFSLENPSVKFFHNLYELVDDKRRRIYKFHFPSLTNQFKALATGNFVACIGGFISRDIYENVRFNTDPKMIGAEDYEVWFDVFSRCSIGRIDRVNSGIRDHSSRSVHNGVFNNLAYQENSLISRILGTPHIRQKFYKYTPRIRAGFQLHRAVIHRKSGSFFKSIGLLASAICNDPSVLLTRRFLSSLYNIIKPL